MAYIAADDFRLATLAEYCYGLDLTVTEVDNAHLAAAIAALSIRIDNITSDHFEPETRTLELDVNSVSERLYLPRRTLVVSSVKTRSTNGTLTTESATVYRVFSSLDPTGTFRIDKDGLDRLNDLGSVARDVLDAIDRLRFLADGTATVQVAGTFSWSACPGDIKWALARLVWARFKESRADLDRAETLSNAGMTLRFLESDADHPTGIREVDEILTDYSRNAFLGIG